MAFSDQKKKKKKLSVFKECMFYPADSATYAYGLQWRNFCKINNLNFLNRMFIDYFHDQKPVYKDISMGDLDKALIIIIKKTPTNNTNIIFL